MTMKAHHAQTLKCNFFQKAQFYYETIKKFTYVQCQKHHTMCMRVWNIVFIA
jgi:hypothetical protein